jgi:pimeloyl-ACP methyl ester carboxylesterase
MGGYVALAFAGLFPAAVEGISLVHSMPNADDEEKKAMRTKAIELIQNGGREAFIRQMIPNLFSDSFKQSNPYIVKQRIEESLGMSSDALINFYQAMRERPDTTGVLFSAKFPLQWIIGLNDNIMSYKKILLECHHSPINFVTFYDNCGHMSMMEAPQRLADDLEEFGKYCNHYFRNGNA